MISIYIMPANQRTPEIFRLIYKVTCRKNWSNDTYRDNHDGNKCFCCQCTIYVKNTTNWQNC